MTTFKPFPELVVDDTHKLSPVIRLKSGDALVMTDVESVKRLVDCWNACRKLYSPANHINETEEYVKRLETLRKEAWATAVELGANEFRAPGSEPLWPL